MKQTTKKSGATILMAALVMALAATLSLGLAADPAEAKPIDFCPISKWGPGGCL
jgi:hypothetical protein